MFRPLRPTFSQSRSGGTSSSPTTAQGAPGTKGQSLWRDPGAESRREERAFGRSAPERLRAPRELPQLSKRRRPPPPPSPKRGARRGRLLARSPRGRASRRQSPRHGSDPGPALGAPRPHHRGRLAPPRRPCATTPRRLPAPHPPRRRAPGTPAPCQPDAALPYHQRNPAGAPPRPRRPPPQRPPAPTRPPRRDTAPSSTAGPADRVPPTRPSPCLWRSFRAHTRRSPGQPPALSAARSRLLQPGTRRDIGARIPTPGLFLGDRPRPDRNSFLPPRVRTTAAVLGVPPPASPFLPFPSAPSFSFPLRFLFRADLSFRWVLEVLKWERRGCGQRVTVEASSTPQGREGRTMFFRVGEETDHPAQEGDDGGLAPGLRAGARFPLKDRVLLEGILVT